MQSKVLSILILLIVFVFFVSTVHAQTPTVSTTAIPTRTVQQERTDYRSALLEKRQTAKETYMKARETFQTRLAALKDEQKKALVERIDARLTTINQNRTDRMLDSLETLSSILTRVSSKAATLKASGENTTALDTAITKAEKSIQTAQTAVVNQAGKEYVAQITTETTLSTTVGKTVKQLQTDLRTVHKLVVLAKQAVQQTIMEHAKIQSAGKQASKSAEAEE